MFVFWKKISSFLDIHWHISGLLSDCFSAGSSKLLPTCPEESFEEKQFSEIYCFPSFQDSELKDLGLFWKISAGLSKQYLTCPSKHFDENVFFRQSSIIFGIQRKNCGFLSQVFRLSRQNWILVVNTKIKKKFNIVRKYVITFETLSDKSSASSQKNNWGCQNSILPVHGIILMNFFFGKKCSNLYWWVSVNFLAFRPNKFWLSCQSCVLRVNGKILKDPCFEKKFILFRHWTNFFLFPAFCSISFSGVFKTAS